MIKPRQDELRQFLSWRRKTRFIRHHGGPLLALALFIAGILFVRQAYLRRFNHERNRPPEAGNVWQMKLPDSR